METAHNQNKQNGRRRHQEQESFFNVRERTDFLCQFPVLRRCLLQILFRLRLRLDRRFSESLTC